MYSYKMKDIPTLKGIVDFLNKKNKLPCNFCIHTQTGHCACHELILTYLKNEVRE